VYAFLFGVIVSGGVVVVAVVLGGNFLYFLTLVSVVISLGFIVR